MPLKIISTVFLIAAGFLYACNGPNQPDQTSAKIQQVNPRESCIFRIIALDDSLGTIRNHDCEEITLSATIQKYVREIKSLDFSECPEDFKLAFTKHLNAWTAMIPITDHYPELRGEMHDLFKDLENSEHAGIFNEKLNAIWDTWAEVDLATKSDEAQ